MVREKLRPRGDPEETRRMIFLLSARRCVVVLLRFNLKIWTKFSVSGSAIYCDFTDSGSQKFPLFSGGMQIIKYVLDRAGQSRRDWHAHLIRRRPIDAESIGSAAPHPSLQFVPACAQSPWMKRTTRHLPPQRHGRVCPGHPRRPTRTAVSYTAGSVSAKHLACVQAEPRGWPRQARP